MGHLLSFDLCNYYLSILLSCDVISSDLTSHTIKTTYSVIDSFDDFLSKYPSIKPIVAIEDIDLEKLMRYGSEDEKKIITEAIRSGDSIDTKYVETIYAMPDITRKIASKTHVFFASVFQIAFISGETKGVVDPTVHVARERIFPRPVGIVHRNDLDKLLVNILNKM